MTEYLGYGLLLGVSSGFSPGPLMTLVLTQTLRHGVREGVKVALSPLLTDAPIITGTVLLMFRVADVRPLFGTISLCGSLFVACLAWGTIRTTRLDLSEGEGPPRSLFKGALTNLLNPHPYLFWLTVGAPTLVRGWETGGGAAAAFVAGFSGSLVGAKIILALLAARSRQLLSGRVYGWTMKLLGFFLFLFAMMLFREGLALITSG